MGMGCECQVSLDDIVCEFIPNATSVINSVKGCGPGYQRLTLMGSPSAVTLSLILSFLTADGFVEEVACRHCPQPLCLTHYGKVKMICYACEEGGGILPLIPTHRPGFTGLQIAGLVIATVLLVLFILGACLAVVFKTSCLPRMRRAFNANFRRVQTVRWNAQNGVQMMGGVGNPLGLPPAAPQNIIPLPPPLNPPVRNPQLRPPGFFQA